MRGWPANADPSLEMRCRICPLTGAAHVAATRATAALPNKVIRRLLGKVCRQNSYTLQTRPGLTSASRRSDSMLKDYVTALGSRTRARAKEIRACYAVRKIAEQFGVDPGTVQRISRPFEASAADA
jgi:hypothetical protein